MTLKTPAIFVNNHEMEVQEPESPIRTGVVMPQIVATIDSTDSNGLVITPREPETIDEGSIIEARTTNVEPGMTPEIGTMLTEPETGTRMSSRSNKGKNSNSFLKEQL